MFGKGNGITRNSKPRPERGGERSPQNNKVQWQLCGKNDHLMENCLYRLY